MKELQSTFADLDQVRHIRALTTNQRKIISLLSCGLTQSSIAKKLGFSRPYINQVIKKLETVSLIKRVNTQKAPEGTRKYNYFYEVAPECKIGSQPFTSCRVHNIRKKFTILSQSGPASLDKRIDYLKSWNMRGGQRHKFWYPGRAGLPSVTVDVHPKTIVVYVDKGQFIAAKDAEQAKEIAWYALYAARDKFIEGQERYGNVTFEIERTGEDIAKVHYGFLFDKRSPIAQEHTDMPGWWIDKSPEETLGPNIREIETDIPDQATALERGIRQIQCMPEAMKTINEKLDPMNQNIIRVEAMLQGGITLSQQYTNMVNFMTKALDEMAAMREELRLLKNNK